MKIRICLRCGRGYTESPALSRTDNETDLCPDCGLAEALGAVPMDIGLDVGLGISISPCPTCGIDCCPGKRDFSDTYCGNHMTPAAVAVHRRAASPYERIQQAIERGDHGGKS